MDQSLLNTLRVGDTLLLDDGKLRMKVLETTMNLHKTQIHYQEAAE
jgi:pyruvate kinase